MAIDMTCGCGRTMRAKDEHAGRRARCQGCGQILTVPVPRAAVDDDKPIIADEDDAVDSSREAELLMALREIRGLLTSIAESAGASKEGRSARQYKVLTQKDKWFSGKFDPERLEQAINAYAGQGWSVCGVTTASFPGLMGGARDEMIVLLER